MSITVGSRTTAEPKIGSVALRRLLGAYELVFPLDIRVSAEDGQPRVLIIAGANVVVRASAGGCPLGFARPQFPIRLVPVKYETSQNAILALTLAPAQIEALEDLRSGGDLDFDLTAMCEADDKQNRHQVQEQLRVTVPQSAWIAQLRSAGALNILLLEIPMIIDPPSAIAKAAQSDLVTAQRHFLSGEYESCASYCRRAMEKLGEQAYGAEWWSSIWSDLSNKTNRELMTKEKREQATIATIRHYTHLAVHPEKDGERSQFSRSDAKFILSLTAAAAARIWG
jgi:hypothetical protein